MPLKSKTKILYRRQYTASDADRNASQRKNKWVRGHFFFSGLSVDPVVQIPPLSWNKPRRTHRCSTRFLLYYGTVFWIAEQDVNDGTLESKAVITLVEEGDGQE